MNKVGYFTKMEYKDGGIAFSAMICLYIFITFIGQALLSVIVKSQSTANIAISSLFSPLAMLAVIVYYRVLKRGGLTELTGIKKFKIISLAPSILLAIGMLFGLGFVNGLFVNLLESVKLNINVLVLPFNSVGDLIIFLVVLALIPAIVEEIFFRGLLLNALKNSKSLVAIICISICFALYHCSASQLVYQIIYGAGLTMLALYTKSTVPGMIVHFINNAVVILLEYFNAQINLMNIFGIIGGIICLAVFVFIVVKKLKKHHTVQENNGAISKFFIPFGIFGVAICTLMLILNLIPAV